MSAFPQMAKIVPAARKGVAVIDHYTPTKFDIMMAKIHRREASDTTVARLMVNGRLMMSDGDDEKRSNHEFAFQSRGRVLIAGLGIGMILKPALDKADSVTVVEKYQDVVDLVEPHVRHSKLSVICADIFNWKPARGSKFDCIYFDIWPDICVDNLKEMATLHQRFKSYKAAGGWMESWQRSRLKREARRW